MEGTLSSTLQPQASRFFSVAFATFVVLLLCGWWSNSAAQSPTTGRIMGKVVTRDSGEPLIGASVMIDGTKLGAMADLDGNYILNNVPVGVHRLIVSAIGHTRTIIDSVSVEAGQTAKLDFSLKSEAVVGQDVVVEAARLKDTEAALLNLRQQAPAAQDAISSEVMSRSGAGDAAAALTRVTGSSVIDGRTAVVRGLSGRYSNTQLNGAQLPSTDPDKPAVQLDLIPAGLLDNITVQKTFTPDRQGNFSGGAINLSTKDLPERMTLKFSSSLSYNSNVSLQDGVLTHSSGPKEWLGFDDGFRSAPAEIVDSSFRTPGYTTVGDSRNAAGAEYLDRIAKSLSRDFAFTERRAPLNQGYGLSFGNLYQLFNRPLGVLGSLTYSRNNSYSGDGIYRRYEVERIGTEVTGLGTYLDYADRKASEEVLWGGLLTANLLLSPNHRLRFSFNRNQHGEKISRQVEGIYTSYTVEAGQRLRSHVWQYTERSMQALQYGGEHSVKLPLLNRTRIEWSATTSRNRQDDPDLRFWTDIANYDENDSLISAGIVTGFPYPTHFFRYLTETNREYKVDFSVPIEFANPGSKLRFGTAIFDKSRSQDNWLIRLNPSERPDLFSSYNGDPGSILTDDKIGKIDSTFNSYTNSWNYLWGIVPENLTQKADVYRGDQDILAFYGMIDWKLTSRFDLIAGARLEHTDQWVETIDTTSLDFRGAYSVADWLPSVNLVYHAQPDMNLRGAFSITTARPTIREMAPFYSYEFLTGNNNIGNPRLTRTLIRNWDLRWEWFTRPGEVIAVSGFYKHFSDPIERFNLSENGDISFLNVSRALVYGAEFEVRRRLDHTGIAPLQNFQLGANLTIVRSEVDIDARELAYRLSNGLTDSTETKRPFGGQSPYVLNFDIAYTSPSTATEIAFFYNIFGNRLAEVGYQAPDIFEKSRQQADLTITQRVLGPLTARFAAKNLFDEDRKLIQTAAGKEYIRSLSREGRTYTLGLTYSL